MKYKIIPPQIPEDQQTPLVMQLLAMIETQASIIQSLNEQNQQLKDEIARLKNHSPRPKIKPSQLEGNPQKNSDPPEGKRPGSVKKAKTADMQIHNIEPIEPDSIPKGSTFRYYKDYVIQDIKFEPFNTLYRLKVYMTPDGDHVYAKLPDHLTGKHFGPTLECYILSQYHQCHVTQPLLLEQLHELGVDISAGTLNNIITETKDDFHNEKDAILAAGLKASSYVNVDDTGARHNGQNGYCTHIGNELFSFFESTASKSRINFLKLMRAGQTDYMINPDAIAYMQESQLPKSILPTIISGMGMEFADENQWQAFLSQHQIVKERHAQIATEGALIGSIVEHGLSDQLVIISDDAGQFNVLLHGLCWIHAERTINKIVPFTDQAKDDLNRIRDQIWNLYDDLKQYKQHPDSDGKQRLEALFEKIFTTKTTSASLNQALTRLYRNKSELLLVLDRPDIPLHNNTAERDIREYVKKRKISGSTRSEAGRKCRDTFASLKKTCRKLGISFWRYLNDRVRKLNQIPLLPDLILTKAVKSD